MIPNNRQSKLDLPKISVEFITMHNLNDIIPDFEIGFTTMYFIRIIYKRVFKVPKRISNRGRRLETY